MKDFFSPLDEAKYNVVHDYPGGGAKLGPLAGINPQVLNSKVNPTMEAHHLMVDEAVRIQHISGDCRILYAEAAMLAHTCIRLGEFSLVSDMELLNSYANMHREFGETAAAINAALQDGSITRKEFLRIDNEMIDDVRAIYALRARLEALVDG